MHPAQSVIRPETDSVPVSPSFISPDPVAVVDFSDFSKVRAGTSPNCKKSVSSVGIEPHDRRDTKTRRLGVWRAISVEWNVKRLRTCKRRAISDDDS